MSLQPAISVHLQLLGQGSCLLFPHWKKGPQNCSHLNSRYTMVCLSLSGTATSVTHFAQRKQIMAANVNRTANACVAALLPFKRQHAQPNAMSICTRNAREHPNHGAQAGMSHGTLYLFCKHLQQEEKKTILNT